MCEIDWSLFFDGLTAIASISAVIIAIVIARKISFKKDIKQRQLETVVDLVKILQDLRIHVRIRIPAVPDGSSGVNSTMHYPFFELSKDHFSSLPEAQKRPTEKFFVSQNFLYEHPMFQFVHNPFLPKEIASKLIMLYPRGGGGITFINLTDATHIAAYNELFRDGEEFREEISNTYRSLGVFFTRCGELTNSILDWLKKNEVEDLNLRTKHINMKNFPT